MKKQCFVNFYSLWIKNRTEKDTFEAYGKSSKARKLQLREESSRAICMSPVLSESAGRKWHPEAVYCMVSVKMLERTLRTTFHHTAFKGPTVCWLEATERWKASEQLWLLCPVPADLGYHSNFIFGNSPRIGRLFACGTLISTLNTNRSQTGSWSLAI